MADIRSIDLVSSHEVSVYEAVRANDGWLTAKQIAATASVACRTARHHCRELSDAGVFEVQKVFGGYRYRFARKFEGDAAARIEKMEQAKRILA